MNHLDEIQKHDSDNFQMFEKQPSKWPRVIGFGMLGLGAVLLVAYSTFEIGSVATAFIGEQTLRPVVLLVIVLVAIAGVFLIP